MPRPFKNDKSMDPAGRLMLLPVEAQKRFEQAAQENQHLKYYFDAQKVIIGDLSRSLGDGEAIEKDLQAVDEQLANVDRQLVDGTAVLLDRLSSSSTADVSGGQILKLIIERVLTTVSELALRGVSQGSISISIMGIVELEGLIRKMIEDLSQQEMYPESTTETEARLTATNNHTVAVLQFIQGYLQAQKVNA
jgi:hypothetical protein